MLKCLAQGAQHVGANKARTHNLLFMSPALFSYNHGKNGWHTLSDLGEKETPFPQCNVDPSHVVRNHARSPNIDLMGSGKDNGKSENLCFVLHNVMPHFLISVESMGIVVINCIRCANYFSMVVEHPRGIQIWFGRGCATGALKPLPIFKAQFGRKKAPIFGGFFFQYRPIFQHV